MSKTTVWLGTRGRKNFQWGAEGTRWRLFTLTRIENGKRNSFCPLYCTVKENTDWNNGELKMIKEGGGGNFLWFIWDMLPQEGKSSKCSCCMELERSVVTLEGKYSHSSKWLVHSPNIYILSRQIHSDTRMAISLSLYSISSSFLSSVLLVLRASFFVSLCFSF